MTPNVKKLKLLKVKDGHGLTLTIDTIDPALARMDGPLNYRGLIHPDLKQALDGLKIHFALLVNFVSDADVDDILQLSEAVQAKLEKVSFHGYSLGGDEDKPGIVISGHYLNFRGKAVNTHTPFELFDTAPEARYRWMDHLLATLRVVETAELQPYLDGTKRGGVPKTEEPAKDDRQVTMDFNQPDDDKVTTLKFAPAVTADPDTIERVAEMDKKEKKSATRRRKVKQTPETPSGETEEEDSFI